MDVIALSKKIQSNYFDYQKLSQAIESSHVRRDISKLIKNKHIIRIKKGLYIWGDDLRKGAYLKEVLSNLIYGPSYISLEYALSHHGLIPERVHTVTAVTIQKNKHYETLVGNFEYRHTHANSYPWGVQRVVNEVGEAYLIAGPEKALLDYIALVVRQWGEEDIDYQEFLFEDLRMDQGDFEALDHEKMVALSGYYKSKAVKTFAAWIARGMNHG